MTNRNLLLSLPDGVCTATTLDVEGLASHRSPGSGQVFQGRAVYVELPIENEKAGFKFFDEGGWRDAAADTAMAIGALGGKRTKSALSNNAFSVIPIEAYKNVWIAKTGGHALELQKAKSLAKFQNHDWRDNMGPDDIAAVAGLSTPHKRTARCYLVLGPIELLVLSTLTPEEYVWYATHRPGKLFRQVMFTEVKTNHRGLIAESIYEQALAEMTANPKKKTKVVYSGSAYDKIPFKDWFGYDGTERGGLYAGNREHVVLWGWPEKIPRAWDRADG